MLTAELTGRNPGFSLAEDTDDLFVGKTLLHGDVLMWLMKTLLTSGCTNQRGAGQSTRSVVHILFRALAQQDVPVVERPVKPASWVSLLISATSAL